MTQQVIMAASAAAPGVRHLKAVEALARGVSDPVLGRIHIDQVQLCPQHAGTITDQVVDELMEAFPQTKFRIHATPRVQGSHRHQIAEAVDADKHPEQMHSTAMLSRRLGAPGYTLHAGRREKGNLKRAFDNVRRLEDLFECPVGIEGLYPSSGRNNMWLLATWEEHEEMLHADVKYALDLSHLQILAKRERCIKHDLLIDLLSSKNCMEVHVSDNDARADSHRMLDPASPPWWLSYLPSINDDAVLFYEGIAIDPRRRSISN